ncbi:MAG: ABC transporter substrate-binding protein [Myxococcota bacterium]
MQRFNSVRAIFVLALIACQSNTTDSDTNTGGISAQGGSAQGGASNGGALQGGAAQGGAAQGGVAQGGATLGGLGGAIQGGAAQGGTALGGAAVGGATHGGAAQGGSAQGGAALGGATSRGGASSGGAGGGGSAAGGSSGAATFPALRITSDTSSIEFTPALIAAQDFYPGKATVSSGGIPTLLTNTDIDLGTNAETQALRQSVDHPNLRIIFTTTETFYRIVASKKAGILALADLRGKRIGTIPNTSAAFYADKMLRSVGLSSSDVTLVSGGICMATPCGTNTLPSMLQRGAVDAMTLWEPSAELSLQALGSDAVVFQERSLYREIVNLHTTAEKLAQPEKRRAIVEFVRALAKAHELYRTQPEMVWPRIVQAIGIQQAVLEAVWEDERFAGTLVPDLLDVLEEEEVWVAKERNRTPRSRTELATLIDTSVMRDALGEQ